MNLPHAAIARPVTVAMVFIGLAIIGVFSAFRLPLEQFPEVEVPYVGLSIPYGNSTAQEIERNVTRPVEEVLSTMGGIDRMFSFTRPGNVFFNISLDPNQDVTGKGIEAKELVENIRHLLPDDVRYVNLRQRDPNDEPLVNILITAPDLNPDTAFEVLETQVRAELERIPGVNSVELYGIVEDEVHIELDPGRVAAYGLDYVDIQRRLQRENFFVSAGNFETTGRELQVRPMGRYEDLDSIRRLPIKDNILLDDVASVVKRPSDETNRRLANGERSVGVSVFKRPEANLVAVAREVEQQLVEISEEETFRNATFHSMDSVADSVVRSLNDLRDSGMMGGLLSVIVLFLFLRRIQTSLLIAATVPLAMCATLGLMYFLGMTLNLLSMVGLMLGIGLLVDNSVVSAEAIALRRRDPDTTPKEAAEKGVSEVALAITAGTLTTVVVFVPSFMTDIQQVATIQQNIAVPLCTALLGSLLVAQTLVPSVMARLPLPKHEPKHAFIDALANFYDRAIRVTLSHRFLSFVMASLIAGSGWYAYKQLDVNMNPEQESDQLRLSYYVRGSMDIEYIETFIRRVDGYLLDNRERFQIKDVFTSYDTDRGSTTLTIREDATLTPQEIQDLVMKDIPELPNIFMRFRSGKRGFGGRRGGDGGLTMRLVGDSTDELLTIGDDVVAMLEQHPMLTNVQHDGESNRVELNIRYRPEVAGQLGITARQISQSLQVALGNRAMTRGFVEKGRETNIYLELEEADDADLDTVRELAIFKPDGGTVPLETVADLTFDSSIRVIRRENRETSLNVNFGVRNGPPAVGRTIVEDAMAKYQMPPGYRWQFGRDFDDDNQMFREMIINVVMAILLVYMLMAALFESVLFPTTVIIAIGYSAVGVFLFLWATGTQLTAMALTGMLLLSGIVVNNGIVLLNRIQQLRRDGVARLDAIAESGRHRLRPILMTVCTTIAGMIPLALGETRVGGMGPSYYPMARALIGGLAFSTIITLLVLPLMYVLFDDMKNGLHAFWVKTRGRAAALSGQV